MATDLLVYGPFEINYNENGKSKRIESEHALMFWDSPETSCLRRKCGCYIFATRAGRGFTPWYVGKASKGFAQEAFTDHKLKHYNKPLFTRRKGNPVLFFIAPPNKKNKVPSKDLDHMEKELIQYAVQKNPDLCNVQNTKNLPQWSIQGVIRSPRGKPPVSASVFKTMMKI